MKRKNHIEKQFEIISCIPLLRMIKYISLNKGWSSAAAATYIWRRMMAGMNTYKRGGNSNESHAVVY